MLNKWEGSHFCLFIFKLISLESFKSSISFGSVKWFECFLRVWGIQFFFRVHSTRHLWSLFYHILDWAPPIVVAWGDCDKWSNCSASNNCLCQHLRIFHINRAGWRKWKIGQPWCKCVGHPNDRVNHTKFLKSFSPISFWENLKNWLNLWS